MRPSRRASINFIVADLAANVRIRYDPTEDECAGNQGGAAERAGATRDVTIQLAELVPQPADERSHPRSQDSETMATITVT